MSDDLQSVRDDVVRFASFAGVKLYPWQVEAFGVACERAGGRFKHRVAAVSVPRGNGKSYAAALVGLWRLLTGPPPQDIVSTALDYEGARVVLDHARSILRACAALADVVEDRADGFRVPSTGSRWEIKSREHTASRGRHATLAIMDETGWLQDDSLFSSLLAGQASVADPLLLVVSTVGRRQGGPLWTIKRLAEGGDEAVCWWHSARNESPLVTRAFLARQRRILVPAQYAREHENAWIDAADSFVSAEDVDKAASHGWRERVGGMSDRTYHAAVDVGLVSDPTVVGVAHAEPDGTVYLDVMQTFQGSKRRPVELAAVERALLELAARFKIASVRIESWQGAASVQRLASLGLPVELYTPTPKSQQNEWPVLAHAFAEGRLVLFPHERLREELLGLTVEVGPTGAKVVDRGRVHQDHATVLRMLAATLLGVPEPLVLTSKWRPGFPEAMESESRAVWGVDW